MEKYNSFTIPIKKQNMNSLTAIIIADKRNHPLHSINNSTYIENHVAQLVHIYKNIDIVYIGGKESVDVKNKIPTLKVIENAQFNHTNDGTNIRLAMMYTNTDSLLIMKCGISIDNTKMSNIISHNKNITFVKKIEHKNIGATVTDGKITYLAYGLEYEWVPIVMLNNKQISEFYKVVFKNNPNKMFHELLNKHIETSEIEAVL